MKVAVEEFITELFAGLERFIATLVWVVLLLFDVEFMATENVKFAGAQP